MPGTPVKQRADNFFLSIARACRTGGNNAGKSLADGNGLVVVFQ